MHYKPLLPNGQEAPLTWQIKLFFLNINWPIKDNAPKWVQIYDRVQVICGFLTLIIVFLAEASAVVERWNDMGPAMEATATDLVSFELVLRIFSMAFFKESFKRFIKEFYLSIYIEKTTNRKMYGKIQDYIRPAVMYSYFYMTTLLTYFMIPIQGFIVGERNLPFLMRFPYDTTIWPTYIPTLVLGIWAGVMVVANIISESYLLVTLILHLNGRFVLLQEEITNLGSNVLLKTPNTDFVNDVFNEQMLMLVKRNIALHNFAQKVNKQFSFRIFATMSVSAVLLCIVGFEMQTIGWSYDNIKYACWLAAKIIELIVVGRLGSLIWSTTDQMTFCYYQSGWENIISKSTNAKANVQTMKLIRNILAVMQKPFALTGLRFFNVNLETSVTILRGGASYFTFLCSMR